MTDTKKYEYKNLTVRPTPEQEEEIIALKKYLSAGSKSQACIKAIQMYIPHEIEIEALEKQGRELKQENNDMKRSMHEFVTAQKEITKFAKTYEPNGYY